MTSLGIETNPCPQNVEIEGISTKKFKISFYNDEMQANFYDDVHKCHTKQQVFIITFPNFNHLLIYWKNYKKHNIPIDKFIKVNHLIFE